MDVFHVFKIVQMVPNRATHHIFVCRFAEGFVLSFQGASFIRYFTLGFFL